MEQVKSVVVKKFGGYDVLNVQQHELPPLEGKIEVRVEYGGVNFADLYTRQGLMSHKSLPFVLGMECVGTVAAVGVENTNLKVGQRVIVYDYQGGMYRETVRVAEDKCYPLPDGISFKEGAAVFVNFMTAYFTVIEQGHLKENESVLILSCAGGVGWAATQLSKTIAGVKVVGTAASDKHEVVLANGVDVVLTMNDSFEKDIVEAWPGGFDLIVSNQSGHVFGFLQTLLKPLGRIVLIGANNMIRNEGKLSTWTLLKNWWTSKNVSLLELITCNRVVAGLHLGTLIEKDHAKVREALAKVFRLLEEKKVVVKIDEVYKIDDVVEAMKRLAERKNVGKVLISMK